MRRVLILSIILFLVADTFAQIQQVYVKTIGRPNSPGVALGGVTVRISGNVNTVVTNQQGTFSFPLKEQRFKFSRVDKKGYELADLDLLHSFFGYSPQTPVTIAMISREELRKEKDAIEEKVRNQIALRIQKQNAILEQKLEKKQLSEEECRKQMLALQDKFDNLDTLVSALSDRYARTDYDNIDSIRLVINSYIENGELERAQQMILSKGGGLEKRSRELEETRRLRLQTQQREEELQKDLAEDLYQLYDIAKAKNKLDSAYIYLEQRYYTDTTQVNYLSDLVWNKLPTLQFPKIEREQREQKHLSYLFRLYDYYNQKTKSLEMSDSSICITLYKLEDEIGSFYYFMGNNTAAIEFYEKSLNTLKAGKVGYEYYPLIYIGNVYRFQRKYQQALSYYREAYSYCPQAKDYINYYVQNRIADIYYLIGDKDTALKEYIKSERIITEPEDSDTWKMRELFILQGFIAYNYQNVGKDKVAINYYLKAIQNAERYFNLTKGIKMIEPMVIMYRELQNLYALQGDYKKMYNCAEKSLKYAELYMSRMPSTYSRLFFAEALCQMADANANMGKTSIVEQELIECLKKSEFASNIFKSRYQKLTYAVYNSFATNYAKQGDYQKALNVINKSVEINPNEIIAYKRKIDILNSMGKKDDAQKVMEELSKKEKVILEESYGSLVATTNPLLQYENLYLRNR